MRSYRIKSSITFYVFVILLCCGFLVSGFLAISYSNKVSNNFLDAFDKLNNVDSDESSIEGSDEEIFDSDNIYE